MSERAHMWIRLVALAVLVAIACLPHGERASAASTPGSGHAGHTVEVARK